MSKRRLKREREVSAELSESINISSIQEVVGARPDTELFVIDRNGSTNSRKKILKFTAAVDSGKLVSATDEKLVQKNLSKTKLAKTDFNVSKKQSVVDLWAENVTASQAKTNKGKNERQKKAIVKVVPGQSYNPSLLDHQDALGEVRIIRISVTLNIFISFPFHFLKALALEMKKQLNKSKNLQESNLSLIEDNSYNSDNEASVSTDNEATFPKSKSNKVKDKVVKSKRNRQKLRRIEEYNAKLEKIEKVKLKNINNLHQVVKEVDTEEKNMETKRMLKRSKVPEVDPSAMTYQEAGSVPLTDELMGSLRMLQPRGSVIHSQVSSMVLSGDLMPKDRRKQKKYEKPHAGKQIKWFAKYKY